uniref:Uncharacterized protein n=1 Tax=Stomoxys calcitrans TaxID=35570 RepID=A0A1I8Q1P0_STOCA
MNRLRSSQVFFTGFSCLFTHVLCTLRSKISNSLATMGEILNQLGNPFNKIDLMATLQSSSFVVCEVVNESEMGFCAVHDSLWRRIMRIYKAIICVEDGLRFLLLMKKVIKKAIFLLRRVVAQIHLPFRGKNAFTQVISFVELP